MRRSQSTALPLLERVPTASRRATRWLAWLVGIAGFVAVLVVARNAAEPREFVTLAERAEPWWIAAAIALQVATYAALAQVWRAVARAAGTVLSRARAMLIALAKLFVDQSLPSVGVSGSALLALSLEQAGTPRPVVVATVVVDLASSYGAYAIALLLATPILVLEHQPAAVLAVTFGAAALGAGIAAVAIALTRRSHRPARVRLIARAQRWLADADRRLTSDPGVLGRATGWQLAIVALDGATLWALIRAAGVSASLAGVYASFMIASLARTISIVPGGLGVFEGVAILMLHQIGVPYAAALSATFLFRAASYWLPMVPGFVASRKLSRDAAARSRIPGAAPDR